MSNVTKYYYFAAQRVAMRNASGVFYLHSDHLGSTSLTTNANGNLTNTQLYYAFGKIRASIGSALTDYGFTGEKLDNSTGLMYYHARYYDPESGRFGQPDTLVPGAINPQNLNHYSYARNNPVIYTDPSGHCPTCVIGAALGAALGAIAYTVSVGVAANNGKGNIWNYNAYAAAIVTGAVAGALIGSGVASQAGVETAAGFATQLAVNAGVGVASSEVGYLASSSTSGESDASDLIITSAGGGVYGALGPSSVVATVATGAVVAGAERVISNAVHARDWDESLGDYMVAGGISGALSGRYPRTKMDPTSEVENVLLGSERMPSVRQRVGQTLVETAPFNLLRSSLGNIISDFTHHRRPDEGVDPSDNDDPVFGSNSAASEADPFNSPAPVNLDPSGGSNETPYECVPGNPC